MALDVALDIFNDAESPLNRREDECDDAKRATNYVKDSLRSLNRCEEDLKAKLTDAILKAEEAKKIEGKQFKI